MKLIWTKSAAPLSLLIRWGLKEPCSHFAIVFDEDKGGIVFESNLLGSHIKYYPTFKKHCEVVHEIDLPMSLEEEEDIYQAILDRYDDKSYDFGAFTYFLWRGCLKRFFGKPFPAKNAWGSENSYICVGLALALKDEKDKLPKGIRSVLESTEDFEMVSPEQLFKSFQLASSPDSKSS